MVALIGWLGFLASSILLGLLLLIVIARWAHTPSTAFFLAIAIIGLDLGTVAVAASFFHLLTPGGWLLFQTLLTVGVVSTFRDRRLGLNHLGNVLRRVKLRFLQLGKDRISVLGLILILLVVSVSLYHQLLTPVSAGDDTAYVGARVTYWIQHHDLFQYRNNNERQVVFPFGGELYFLFPLLFTREEWLGRMVIWLGFPLSAISVFVLLRAVKAGDRAAIWGALIFLTAPQVARASICIKPELWSTVYAVGSAFFCIVSARTKQHSFAYRFVAGIFVGLAITTKFTMLTLVPALLISAYCVWQSRRILQRFAPVIGGLIVGLVLGGGALTLLQNYFTDGHPLGPEPMREVHSADISLSQLRIHSERLVTRMIDIPFIPTEHLRNQINSIMNSFAALTGAARPLRWENETGWPGLFRFDAQSTAQSFSLIGIVWLPVLILGMWRAMFSFIRAPLAPSLKPNEIVAIFGSLTLVGIVSTLRWQESADVPFRFLLPCYAFAVVLVVSVAERFIGKKMIRLGCIGALILFAISPTIVGGIPADDGRTQARRLWFSPYVKVAALLPIRSRIVHIGGQNGAEYYLFDSERGYQNSVFAWGRKPFDASSLRELIESSHATHVLVDDDRQVTFHWHPILSTRRMVEWLLSQQDLQELRQPQPHMRLFVVRPKATKIPG